MCYTVIAGVAGYEAPMAAVEGDVFQDIEFIYKNNERGFYHEGNSKV